MTKEQEQKNQDPMFLSLVLSLAQAALACLGKIAGPSGEVHRDLPQAKLNIDMIAMLKERTVNNLTKDEDKILSSTLADLQLNYTDEKNK